MWARNGRWILSEMPDFHVAFRNLLHAVNLRHGTDGFTSPPKEGVLRIFSLWKFRRLRPGFNPRAWVPKASTLPLDHRSRLVSPLRRDFSEGTSVNVFEMSNEHVIMLNLMVFFEWHSVNVANSLQYRHVMMVSFIFTEGQASRRWVCCGVTLVVWRLNTQAGRMYSCCCQCLKLSYTGLILWNYHNCS